MKRDYLQDLQNLTAPLIDLQQVKPHACSCHNLQFVELVESNVSTFFRWDQESGFVLAGESLPVHPL